VTLQLGDVKYDKESQLLTDSNGDVVNLRPQSLSVLHILASNEGKLVDRNSLMNTVWRDIAVTDDSLVQCIGDIRRAIGSDGHKIIQNIPKKGYKLLAPQKKNGNFGLKA
jgi:DNA-binding winged helix-turn-helix (wHTH) protein